MITIPGSEQVEHPRKDVFRAGVRAETWPHIDGLEFQPQDRVLAQGGLLRIALAIPSITVGVDAEVITCNTEAVVMRGESKMARVEIAFDLLDDGTGTRIDYRVELNHKNFLVRLAEPAIRDFLRERVPVFTATYKGNIGRYLS